MHESSLAKDILSQALSLAKREGAPRVSRVCGWVAETEHLEPGSLDFHFQAHAKGTAAEGAVLELDLVHVQARCRSCGEVYDPDHHVTLCPKCNSTEADVLGETGLCIQKIEVE